jgi:hypothetical protein
LNAQTAEDVVKYLSEIGCMDYGNFEGGDPGKGVLLALMDELRRKVTYSATQRRHETDGGNRQILKGKKCRGPNFATRNHKTTASNNSRSAKHTHSGKYSTSRTSFDCRKFAKKYTVHNS